MSSKKEEGPWESSGIMQCRQEVLYNSQADQKGHYCTRLYTSHYIFGQREKKKRTMDLSKLEQLQNGYNISTVFNLRGFEISIGHLLSARLL